MDLAALKQRLERYSDVLMTIGVLAIVSLMVIRIPPGLMDYFIAVNLSISILILLVAMSIKDAVKLPSFPSILLLTTLFRLALNVSTTRLILLEADAGEIIYGFGNVVVGGNFVVGGIVFVVLVLIQFIVIAKGSERAAEVAARFTLDAMAGKQSSIDFDLQQQLITPDDARKRRRNLEREAKLYGAMDGAMKFVKGDAIAGIIISLVNVIGGLIVGVMQQGMAVGEAAEIYSLLTIGDGLVSQLPALFTSVSAGIVITRVAAQDDDKPSHLGRDILQQLFDNPSALKIGAVTFGLVALVCSVVDVGFPGVPFAVVAAVIGTMAAMVWQSPESVEAADGSGPLADAAAAESAEPAATPMYLPAPLFVEHHADLEPLLGLQSGRMTAVAQGQLETQLEIIAQTVSRELGFTIPPIRVRTHRRSILEPGGYQIQVFDGPVLTDRWRVGKTFVVWPAEDLGRMGIAGEAAFLPGCRVRGAYIANDALPALLAREPDLIHYAFDEVFFRQLQSVVERSAWMLLGIQDTQNLIEGLKKRGLEELVGAVLARKFTVQEISDVLQELLREQVSIGDLRCIFESLARWSAADHHIGRITEHVRRDLGRALYDRYTTAGHLIRHYQLSEDFEQMLSAAHGGGRLADTGIAELRVAINRVVESPEHLRVPAVIMTRKPEARPLLRKYIEGVMPEIAVLNLDDMPIEVDMRTIGWISEEVALEETSPA